MSEMEREKYSAQKAMYEGKLSTERDDAAFKNH